MQETLFLWPFLKSVHQKQKKRFESGSGKKKAMDRGEKAYSLAILTIRREETRREAPDEGGGEKVEGV